MILVRLVTHTRPPFSPFPPDAVVVFVVTMFGVGIGVVNLLSMKVVQFERRRRKERKGYIYTYIYIYAALCVYDSVYRRL